MNAVEICNEALAWVGWNPIDDFYPTEDSPAARACARIYEPMLHEILRDHAWSFATRQTVLAASAVEFDDYEYTYSYPPDCLYIQRVLDSDSGDNAYEYVVRTDDGDERVICTDVDEAMIRYTMRAETPNIYDPTFISALLWRLKSEFARMLNSDSNLATTALDMYMQTIRRAKALDANEQKKTPDEDTQNPYKAARG